MTRIAYFNGKFVPETDVVIPYRDRSFNRGDGCFDMTRTFDGRIFRLAEHVERLYRSLRYLRIDIGLEPKEIIAISEEVVLRNEHLRAAAGDWWLAQRVSRGVDAIGDEGWAGDGAVGLDGDGRAGVEYDREPRLPPLPARAQASVTGMAMDAVTRTTTASAMARMFMDVTSALIVAAPPCSRRISTSLKARPRRGGPCRGPP